VKFVTDTLRGWGAEIRGQKSEVRDQKTEAA